jgi:uncharacterized protein
VKVSVAYAAPGVEVLVDVDVLPGACVRDAIERSGIVARLGAQAARLACALHGRRVSLDALLAEGDRVELLRPLAADAMTARRQRAEAHPLPRPAARRKRRAGLG